MKREISTLKLAVIMILVGASTAGCSKDEKPAPTRVAPPAASSAPLAPAAKATNFAVAEKGSATFLIDAPLEKIKGTATRFRGSLTLNPERLEETRGQIDVDLTTLETHTFGEEAKDAKQTEHAHNWLELGDDVEKKQREENQWVRFTIKSVEASPAAFSKAAETDGERRVEVTATGALWLHGVSSEKTVKLAVAFEGSPEAPRAIRVSTVEPITISLKQHDVKPRDIAGKFLQGALEQVGEKIVDQVQVSLELEATAGE